MAAAIVSRRLIVGWRTASINETLDRAIETEGYLELVGADPVKKLDAIGRLSRIYESSREQSRDYYRKRPELVRQKNEKRQAIYKSDYEVFCAQFKAAYPQLDPVTFSRFSRSDIRLRWLKNPRETLSEVRLLAAELQQNSMRAYERYMGRDRAEYKDKLHK